MKSPQDIADPILRDEVLQCIEGDDNYSPDVTLAKQLIEEGKRAAAAAEEAKLKK